MKIFPYIAVIVFVVVGGIYFLLSQSVVEEPMVETETNTYSDTELGFSIDLLKGYVVEKSTSSVKFKIPEETAAGTNLSKDTYISIEQLSAEKTCEANSFMETPSVSSSVVNDDSTLYSVASSTDAGAGNRYEEYVYTIIGTEPCVAVRYFIHYSAIENFPEGAVKEFDKESLIYDFDEMRHSVKIFENMDYKKIQYKTDNRYQYLDDYREDQDIKYFGNELKTDLDNNGSEDVVFFVTQESEGSGTFYYVVAAIKEEIGYSSVEGYFLGDRIAPQTIEVSKNPRHKNVIVVNYADRAEGEPMTTQPSVAKSVYLKVDSENGMWAIVEADFEGESR
ncbi:MAG: hypothetical protein KBD10_01980 [Candidatus Pacebacteria bacterium]|nr:hypothetical protein [Candidatus Paceibacterota bacterium]